MIKVKNFKVYIFYVLIIKICIKKINLLFYILFVVIVVFFENGSFRECILVIF